MGSKRLKGKNKKCFNGKPLVCHSIEFAKKVSSFRDTVCVTTDDKEILELAVSKHVDLVIERPTYLSTDSATSYDVIIHACDIAIASNKEFDTIVLLQPTTPFRSEKDFEMMKKLYMKRSMKAFASISKTKNDDKNRVIYDAQTMKISKNSFGEVGYLNGSIYFFDHHNLINEKKNLEFEDTNYFIMSRKNSIDIDTLEDWNLAAEYL